VTVFCFQKKEKHTMIEAVWVVGVLVEEGNNQCYVCLFRPGMVHVTLYKESLQPTRSLSFSHSPSTYHKKTPAIDPTSHIHHTPPFLHPRLHTLYPPWLLPLQRTTKRTSGS
jgi:hypothetical protein